MYKILVVDDEEKIRRLITKYAEFEGHETVEAADGMEAVRVCRENKFDIIIMDIMMPELDGFSACREIKKFTDTPILMLSARGEEYDRINEEYPEEIIADRETAELFRNRYVNGHPVIMEGWNKLP